MELLPLTILTILTIHQTVQQEIKITPITSGILPFKLGNAKLITSYHSVIQYVDLTPLKTQISQLKTHVTDVRKILSQTNYTSSEVSFFPIDHLQERAKYIIADASMKLDNLRPIKPRAKRGLINVVGKSEKWLFCSLDNNDDEY